MMSYAYFEKIVLEVTGMDPIPASVKYLMEVYHYQELVMGSSRMKGADAVILFWEPGLYKSSMLDGTRALGGKKARRHDMINWKEFK